MTSPSDVTAAGGGRTKLLKHWLVFALSLGAGIGILALLVHGADVGIAGRLTRVKWPWLLVLLACTIGMGLSVAGRWHTIVIGMMAESRVRRTDLAFYFFLGRILAYVTPKDIGDFAVRSVALRMASDFPVQRGLCSILIDRTFDLMTVAMFLVPSLVALLWQLDPALVLLVWIVVPLVAAGVFALFHYRVIALVITIGNAALTVLSRLPRAGKLGAMVIPLSELSFLRDRSVLMRLFVFSLLKFGFNGCRFLVVVKALSLDISVVKTLIGMPVAQGAFMLLGFTPGALGVLEGGWAAAYAALDVPRSEVAVFLLGQRLWIALSVLVAALLFYVIKRLRKNPVRPSAAAAGPSAALRQRAPVFIGCTGGSGSRVVAQILEASGCLMGANLNFAKDNMDLAFCTAGRLTWLKRCFPFERHVDEAVGDLNLFRKLYFRDRLTCAERFRMLRIGLEYLHPANLRLLGTRSPAQRMRSAAGLLFGKHKAEGAREGQGRQGWGAKLPGCILLIPALAKSFPGMRFVHLVRDGRDMALSDNQKLLLHYAALFGLTRDYSVAGSLELWSRMNRWAAESCAAHLSAEQVLVVRFEDLCRHPRPTINRLLEFCGLPAPSGEEVYAMPRMIPSIGRWHATQAAFAGLDTSALPLFGYTD